jgi:hypothetical protein
VVHVSCNLIGSQECDFSTNLIIGFKEPINVKKNVKWQMSKNKKITYVMITLEGLRNFVHLKKKG